MSMADEQARPLTAGEIEQVRTRWRPEAVQYHYALRDYFPLASRGVADVAALLATLDAWRPVLEAVAASHEYPDEALEITGIRTRARHALELDADEEAAWRLAKAAASDASDERMYADAEYFWQQVAESEGSPAPDDDE